MAILNSIIHLVDTNPTVQLYLLELCANYKDGMEKTLFVRNAATIVKVVNYIRNATPTGRSS